MEVEIKLKCSNLNKLKKKLLKTGAILSKTKQQTDIYYEHPSRVLLKSKEYLRLRKMGNIKTLAHHINISNGVNDECEIELEKNADIENLLQRLNFSKLGTIDKKREQYRLKRYNICLDKVKNIGNFIEIELEVGKKDVTEAKKACWQLAQKLGLSKKDEFPFWLCDIAVGKVN